MRRQYRSALDHAHMGRPRPCERPASGYCRGMIALPPPQPATSIVRRIRSHRAGCCADISTRRGGDAQPCAAPITFAGKLLQARRGRYVWAFACAAHKDLLCGARPYGVIAEHCREMRRRRRRDSWTLYAQQGPDGCSARALG